MSLQQVHLRINDAATGQPTPVRLRVTDAAGNYYPPHGHPAEFATGIGEDVGGNLLLDGKAWAYIDGSCEIALPPGELLIEATKGPEYRLVREKINLLAGKLALRFAIERWTDQRAEGWYSGDTRVHFLSPHAALLEAAAEDLAVVNLLAEEEVVQGKSGTPYRTYPNLLAFSGQRPCLERDGHMVVVNTHNTHPALGSVALLNCHRIVYPLTFGGPDATDDWSLDDWCGQCHRKQGLVVWTNAFDPKQSHAGEALANLVLGHIDALELDCVNPEWLNAWYQLLNGGFRVPLVGTSAKDSNCRPLGVYRTYARCGGVPFTYASWIEAVRAGKTFATAGPFLSLSVGGAEIGDELRPGSGQFRAEFASLATERIGRAQLVINGAVAAVSSTGQAQYEFSAPEGGWVSARCWSHGRILAHTSPIYLPPADGFRFGDPAAVDFLNGHLLRAREWAETKGRFSNPKSREHLLGVFDAARDSLRDASSKRC
jgi:hypothetical protein